MSLEFYYHKIKKAHKQHDCEMCGQKIEVGENYSYASGKYEGTIFTTKLHEICKSTLDKTLNAMGEYEYDYDMIADWWKDNKCAICKMRYPECEPEDDVCPSQEDCPECSEGRCHANGVDCDKMDGSCWCTLFEARGRIMDEFYKSFGTNLRRLRIEQNLSAGALSRLSGVTISTINNAETHRVLPMLYSAKMLANALGVGLDDMLKEQEW